MAEGVVGPYRDEEHRRQVYADIAAASAAMNQQQQPAAGGRPISGDLQAAQDDLGISIPRGARSDDEDDPFVVQWWPNWKSRSGTQQARLSVASGDLFLGDNLRMFQERAVAAGLLDPRSVRMGAPDSATVQLWESLLDTSAVYLKVGQKKSVFDLMDLFAPTAGQTGGSERAPLTVELSNPDDVKRLMREAAKEALGSGTVDDAKLDDIVKRWHAEQRNAQTAGYNAAETGGTVTQAPDFETFADQAAREIDPERYDARKMVANFDVIEKMFAGGG